MSNIKVNAKTTGLGRAGQGTYRDATGTLEGGIVTADLSYLFSLNGDVFVANGALGTSEATFAGALDTDAPDLVIDVPLNTTIVPLKIDIYYEAVGASAVMETMVSVSKTLGATSSGDTITPVNIRTGNNSTSSCTVTSAVANSGATVQSGLKYEFFRHGFQLAEDMAATEPGWPEKQYTWSAKKEGIYPILDGEASLFIHAAATAGKGFLTVIYYEIETDNI